MTTTEPFRIAYLTAGAAGMYCGSCMHDNTLARAMIALGADVQLIPMYTPIQTDEPDVTIDQVFFGGINVFLQQRHGLFRKIPKVLDRLLDRPGLLRWIGSRGIETSPKQLGDLAISMLRGSAGFQRKEVDRLCQWLSRSPKPDVVVLTNVLVAGSAPDLRASLGIPVVVTLQGDDVFLEELPPSYKARALEEIQRLADHVDAFLVHSQYYGDFMADYLTIDRGKIHLVPLGIETADYALRPTDGTFDGEDPSNRLRVGYMARLAPEKGLHVLIDAFVALKKMPHMQTTELLIAGWLGKQNREYADAQFAKLRDAGLESDFQYLGAVDRQQKVKLLERLDILSVPTVYREPKGLYVLEALAAGVPVVQPRHGAFPELLQTTGGGLLVPPEDPAALAEALHYLLCNKAERRQLSVTGQTRVHQSFNPAAMASETLGVMQRIVAQTARDIA